MQNIIGGVFLVGALFTLIIAFTAKGKNVAIGIIATVIICIMALVVFFVDPSSVAGQ
jgi:hypothetical protein